MHLEPKPRRLALAATPAEQLSLTAMLGGILHYKYDEWEPASLSSRDMYGLRSHLQTGQRDGWIQELRPFSLIFASL